MENPLIREKLFKVLTANGKMRQSLVVLQTYQTNLAASLPAGRAPEPHSAGAPGSSALADCRTISAVVDSWMRPCLEATAWRKTEILLRVPHLRRTNSFIVLIVLQGGFRRKGSPNYYFEHPPRDGLSVPHRGRSFEVGNQSG